MKPTKVEDHTKDYPTKEVDNLRDIVNVDDDGRKRDDARTHTQEEEEQIILDERKISEKENEVPTEEFVIDKIVNHKINRSRRHRYAKAGEPLYLVRWYGFEEEDDTWEPTKHLPRSKIVSYYRAKKTEILESVEQANDG